ncbi:hypothetical protein CLIB1444_01S07800 [[Candida] jaroonii]|uniref:Uncharacterized protein n=1 Tax=[Candida] jaroonii TaxID=467808 RepID=A0ACA9Y0N1_9ASCO|nr:hypothetical protein CLIB1444_01S07800 [[Candida] jaroonii]
MSVNSDDICEQAEVSEQPDDLKQKFRKSLGKLWKIAGQRNSSLMMSTLIILVAINLTGYYSLYSFDSNFPPVDVVRALNEPERIRNGSSEIYEFLVDTYIRNEMVYLENINSMTISTTPRLSFNRYHSRIEFTDGFIEYSNPSKSLSPNSSLNTWVGSLLIYDFDYSPFKLSRNLTSFKNFNNQINVLYNKEYPIIRNSEIWYMIHISNFLILVATIMISLSLFMIWSDFKILNVLFFAFLSFGFIVCFCCQFIQLISIIIYQAKLSNSKFLRKFCSCVAGILFNIHNAYYVFDYLVDHLDLARFWTQQWNNRFHGNSDIEKGEDQVSPYPQSIFTNNSPKDSTDSTQPDENGFYPLTPQRARISDSDKPSSEYSNDIQSPVGPHCSPTDSEIPEIAGMSCISLDPRPNSGIEQFPILRGRNVTYSGAIKHPGSSNQYQTRDRVVTAPELTSPVLSDPTSSDFGHFEQELSKTPDQSRFIEDVTSKTTKPRKGGSVVQSLVESFQNTSD